MTIAQAYGARSTCYRMKVGAVIALEGRVLTGGYNGAPAGLPHCDQPHEPEQCMAVHAEQNAISFAARHGVKCEGAELYCTHMPCLQCARSIINTGIVAVYWEERYRNPEGVDLLRQAHVEVSQLVRDVI